MVDVSAAAESRLLDALLVLEEAGSISLNRDGCDQLRMMVGGIDLSSMSEANAAMVRESISGIQPSIDNDGEPILTRSVMEHSGYERRLALTELRTSLGGPRFVYHGTTLGRLDSIRKHGLVPDQAPVWKEADLKQHLDSGVFFSESLAAAQNWAFVAFRRGRGRRDSAKRRPIVIRLPAEGLYMEPDHRAMILGCLVSRGAVDVSNAQWALAGEGQPPHWRRFDEQITPNDLPELPVIYKRA